MSETIADIVAWLRDPKVKNPMRKAWRDVLADRIEAAAKREKAQPGNAAAMREAFKKLDKELSFCERNVELGIGFALEGLREHCRIVRESLNAALSAPARNCDLPLVVDGPVDNNADKAWLVFKQHNPDAYYDVLGLARCIDWLLATAKSETKGEADGSK